MATATHSEGARVQTSRWGLVAAELLIAVSAVYGGVGLIRDGLGMPGDWLEASPFDSWRWPGVFLLLVIAVPMAAAAVLEIARSRWAFAASMMAAATQVAWIVVQLAVLRRYFFLQPVLFGAGLLVAGLAFWSHRGQRLIPESRGS